jgi:hypothetical protein
MSEGISAVGGAIAASFVTIDRSRFSANQARDAGGAIWVEVLLSEDPAGSTDPQVASITSSTFFNNRVVLSGDPTAPAMPENFGGAIFASSIQNGGPMVADPDVFATIVNCSFAMNDVDSGPGGAIYVRNDFGGVLPASRRLAANSIFWDNTAATGGAQQSIAASNGLGSIEVDNSIVEGAWTGGGIDNLNIDPAFLNLLAGDLRLGGGSPAIDAGINAEVPNDQEDYDGDSNTMELLPFDIEGQDRVVGVSVDIGADEFGATAQPCNAADVSQTNGFFGTLDVNDSIVFTAAFNNLETVGDIAPAFGVWDVNDIVTFVNAFNAGCP